MLGILALAASGPVAALRADQVQTAPITEPRGAKQEQLASVPKGAAAITEQRDKCSTRLIVNADALFVPHRWTLNPDAGQTLDVLGPMIVTAGKHPARMVSYTHISDSDDENRTVAEKRAITVRGWLLNHHFLPESTTAEPSDRGPSPDLTSAHGKHQGENGAVEVIIDGCH